MTQTKRQLEDWLDDLCVRFIINLPQEELGSVERICFQVEEAQWFYEDFVRPLDPTLPSMTLRKFCLCMFQHCPLFSDFSRHHHMTAFSEFLAYKTRVPVRGAILLNEAMDQVLLVKGWKKGSSWGFPRGKINKNEKDLDCAIREVFEETGFNLKEAGLVDASSETSYLETTLREQNIRLFIFRGVSTDIQFAPRTRKEISKIQWHPLSDLSSTRGLKAQQQDREDEVLVRVDNFYMVAPFLNPLKKWITRNKNIPPPVPANQNLVATTTTTTTTTTESVAIMAGEERALAATVGSASANSMMMLNRQQSPERQGDRDIQREMTVKLKSLLSIPNQSETSDRLASVPEPTNQEKSNALLALLHKNANGTANGTTSRLEQNQRPSGNHSTLKATPSFEQGGSHHHAFNVTQSNSLVPAPVPVPSSHFANVAGADGAHRPHPSTGAQTGSIQTMTSAPWGNEHRGLIAGAPISSHSSTATVSAHGPTARSEPASFVRSASDNHQRPRESSAVSHLRHSSTVHAPIVPVAANLPPPKLSTHSLRLLNVFKGEQGSSSPAPQTRATGVADQALGYQGKVDQDKTNLEPQSAVPSKERYLGLTTAPGHPPRGSTSQIPLGQRAGQPTDHKNKLLSLFNDRSPASRPNQRETVPTVVSDEGFSVQKPVVVSPTAASVSESRTSQLGMSSRSRQASGSSRPTSAANREILTGFLDSIARKGLDGGGA